MTEYLDKVVLDEGRRLLADVDDGPWLDDPDYGYIRDELLIVVKANAERRAAIIWLRTHANALLSAAEEVPKLRESLAAAYKAMRTEWRELVEERDQAVLELDEARAAFDYLRDRLDNTYARLERCTKVFASLRVLPEPFFSPTRGWMNFVPPDPMMYLRALQSAVLAAIALAEREATGGAGQMETL